VLLKSLVLDRRAHAAELRADFEADRRRALQELVGRYHGGTLDSAVAWHYRMLTLYQNAQKGWLRSEGPYESAGYYPTSTVYRFLALQAVVQRFEREQVFIDSRYAEPADLEFVKITKSLHWVMSDTSLFAGLPYDESESTDHFMSDELRAVGSEFGEKETPSFLDFRARLRDLLEERPGGPPEVLDVFGFFDGLVPDEDRLRWDRLICLHVLTMAFIASFGYEWQKADVRNVAPTFSRIRNAEISQNFVAWLPRLGLDDQPCLQPLVPRPPTQPG
jgi:hypothetical protein